MYCREMFSEFIGSPFVTRDTGSHMKGILTEKNGMKFFQKNYEDSELIQDDEENGQVNYFCLMMVSRFFLTIF